MTRIGLFEIRRCTACGQKHLTLCVSRLAIYIFVLTIAAAVAHLNLKHRSVPWIDSRSISGDQLWSLQSAYVMVERS